MRVYLRLFKLPRGFSGSPIGEVDSDSTKRYFVMYGSALFKCLCPNCLAWVMKTESDISGINKKSFPSTLPTDLSLQCAQDIEHATLRASLCIESNVPQLYLYTLEYCAFHRTYHIAIVVCNWLHGVRSRSS